MSISAAILYCEWLSSRERLGWAYRLPNIHDTLPLLVDERAGYWISASEGSCWYAIGQNPTMYEYESYVREVDEIAFQREGMKSEIVSSFCLKLPPSRFQAISGSSSFHDVFDKPRIPSFKARPASRSWKDDRDKTARILFEMLSQDYFTRLRDMRATDASSFFQFDPDRIRTRAEEEHHDSLIQHREFLIDLILLQARLEERLPATEGIRLVRYRQPAEEEKSSNDLRSGENRLVGDQFNYWQRDLTMSSGQNRPVGMPPK